MIQTAIVQKQNLVRVWPNLRQSVEEYSAKNPEFMPDDPDELIPLWAHPDGDNVLVVTREGEYAGFLTFKVQEIGLQRWATIGIIQLSEGILKEVTKQLEERLRELGCQRMSYFALRRGFERLAPSLGFRPRIIEYTKEL